MSKTKTTRYDVAEHLRTPEEMAAYLDACLEEVNGDAAFIAKALGDIACAKVARYLRPLSGGKGGKNPMMKRRIDDEGFLEGV